MSSSYSRSALVYASWTTSTNHQLTCVRWMSSINGSQWSRRWVHPPPPPPPPPTPPRILSVSRRYSWSCLTGHNILSDSPGLRWAMPGMRIHWGAWSGNCVFARNPACGLTTNWSWTSPRVKRQVDTQSACRNDLLLAVASANKNVVLSVRHLRSMRHQYSLDRPSQLKIAEQCSDAWVSSWIVFPMSEYRRYGGPMRYYSGRCVALILKQVQ